MTKPFNWTIFLILLAAAALGLIAVIPYSLALQGPESAAQAASRTGMSLPLLITVQIASQVIVFGAAIWVGLSFANQIGLSLPILEARLRGESVDRQLRAILPISLILGLGSSLLIIALDILVFQPALGARLSTSSAVGKPAAWQGLLASLYGAFDEEILLRLCVMSFLAWVGRFVSRTAEGKPTVAVLWIANVSAAVLFGLGHLPATAAILPLTPLVIARAIVLNGLAGVAFGYLYFKHGLESAMLSHFSADIVLHVLFAI